MTIKLEHNTKFQLCFVIKLVSKQNLSP